MQVAVKSSGPLIDGTANGIVDRAVHDMEGAVADEAVRRVHQRLGQVLKHPTGFYSSRVVKTMRSDGADITDSRVVYGPWLEGVSSRNTRSRFKGYHTFQLVGQQLDTAVPAITAPAQAQMMRGLNGGN